MRLAMQSLKKIFLSLFILAALAGIVQGAQDFEKERKRMVASQIAARGIDDPRVLSAMRSTPRHKFVPESLQDQAYADHPLPIGEGQTISQPYIVALMTEQLNLSKESKVLEIGTGSGYQAAVLAGIADRVYTIEIKKALHEGATEDLRETGYTSVKTRHGDGYFGWPEAAPFDAVIITAAADHIPPPLLGQLKDGGRLILPLGNPFSYQNLVRVAKKGDDHTVRQITGVLFVPMTGEALER